jgi:uncharacterized membrane protein (UPF0127 family)
MENWDRKMSAVLESAKFLNKLNVIDIDFVNGSSLEVYVAMTKEDRSIGLSTLPYLDTDGMMFFYDQPSYNPFTVLDMGFDIDIAWYSRDGKCIKHGTFPAGMDSPIFSPKPYTYVVETLANNLPKSDLKVSNVASI